jgi:alkylated DNA repair dioxygenase AlkB
MFDALWGLQPTDYPEIHLHGRRLKIPRKQQAYGQNYHFSGQTSLAQPVPPLLQPLLTWARDTVHARLNGLLLNWYEGSLGHYIGKHRDSRVNMVHGAPIVTVSFGEERIFRLAPWRGSGQIDFSAQDGSVFVMPYETNLAWTHAVPHYRRYTGRRISVTLRAFTESQPRMANEHE